MNNIDDDDDEDYEALVNCQSAAAGGSKSLSGSTGHGNVTSMSNQQQSASEHLPQQAQQQQTSGAQGLPGVGPFESNLIREDGRPAGLKNIGNTCWFNSIIQAFFHLPKFRTLILSFKFDQYQIDKLDDNVKFNYLI